MPKKDRGSKRRERTLKRRNRAKNKALKSGKKNFSEDQPIEIPNGHVSQGFDWDAFMNDYDAEILSKNTNGIITCFLDGAGCDQLEPKLPKKWKTWAMIGLPFDTAHAERHIDNVLRLPHKLKQWKVCSHGAKKTFFNRLCDALERFSIEDPSTLFSMDVISFTTEDVLDKIDKYLNALNIVEVKKDTKDTGYYKTIIKGKHCYIFRSDKGKETKINLVNVGSLLKVVQLVQMHYDYAQQFKGFKGFFIITDPLCGDAEGHSDKEGCHKHLNFLNSLLDAKGINALVAQPLQQDTLMGEYFADNVASSFNEIMNGKFKENAQRLKPLLEQTLTCRWGLTKGKKAPWDY